MKTIKTVEDLWDAVGAGSLEYRLAQKLGFGDDFKNLFFSLYRERARTHNNVGDAPVRVFAEASKGKTTPEQIESAKKEFRFLAEKQQRKNTARMPPAWS